MADTLARLVRKILVGHTTKIRWIAEARSKTDKLDARILAELVRAELFPSIAIPPKRVRELRELVRGLVRIRRQAARALLRTIYEVWTKKKSYAELYGEKALVG